MEVLVEQNINGKTDTSYIYGVNRLSLDRFDGSTGYYLYDPRGSVSGITNEEGQIYQSYRYSVTGEITFGAPQYENEYTYNGESYNPNIESQYLRARYYNVVTATFLTEDSYLGNINEPLTLNRYNYCVSSYLNYKDPSGKLGEPSGIWLITELLDEGEEVIDEILSFSWNTIKNTKIQCAEAEAEYEARKAEHMANVYASYATPDMQAALAIDSTVGLPAIYNYLVSPLRYGAQGSEHPFIDTFENRKDNTTYFYLGAEELLFDVTDAIKNPELIKSRALGSVIAVIENPEILKPDLIGAAVDTWNFLWYSSDKEFFGTSSKVAVGVGASVILAEAKSWLPKNCGKVDLSDGDISRRATMSTLEKGTGTLSGQWKAVNESMSDFSRAYQKQITGQEGMVWVQNGVKFDGMKDGVLLDAKGKYAQFINPDTGEFFGWFTGKQDFLDEAARQIKASGGASIQWYFAEEEVLGVVQDLFINEGITEIELIFQAPK